MDAIGPYRMGRMRLAKSHVGHRHTGASRAWPVREESPHIHA
jgi:hypothetical protein